MNLTTTNKSVYEIFVFRSNSDVKGNNSDDNFFDELYADFQIKRVKAKRSINANSEKRGELNELLITNYTNKEIKYVKQI